jgi:hypothetical protein
VQTFLPHKDYARCARVLDRQRLGKQRLEARQILMANVHGPNTGWYNHPVTRNWRGFEVDLARYGMAICAEWARRGYRDEQFDVFLTIATFLTENGEVRVQPPWVTSALCSCHRAALLGKDYAHYSQFGWTERPTTGYEWPATFAQGPSFVEPEKLGFCPRDLFPIGDGPEAGATCPKCGMVNPWVGEDFYA